MTDGNPEGMVPDEEWTGVREALDVIVGEVIPAVRPAIDVVRDMIPLVVAAQEERLAISQVEIKPGNEGIETSRGLGVKAEAARVEAVADRRVVGRIPARSTGEHGQGRRINARREAVGR